MEIINRNNYELAFHIDSNLDESGALKVQEDIQKFVTDAGGNISALKNAEKTKLSYPINHQRFSYFGHVHFGLENGEAITEIDEHIRLHPSILRHLTLKLPSDLQKSKTMAKQAKIQETISRRASRSKPAPKETRPEESIQMDKQLEDVIEKI